MSSYVYCNEHFPVSGASRQTTTTSKHKVYHLSHQLSSRPRMAQYPVRITSIKNLTHDVISFVTERPKNYNFLPGQATKVSLKLEGWDTQLKPFTICSLPSDTHLEFCIKIYEQHEGLTKQLRRLKVGDELIIHDVFGTLLYKGEGTFIAGGAGVTPFIAILRDLEQRHALGHNRLLFANKTVTDVIAHDELQTMLGRNLVNIFSSDKNAVGSHGVINRTFLTTFVSDFDQPFYVCGPKDMISDVSKLLLSLGVQQRQIVHEHF